MSIEWLEGVELENESLKADPTLSRFTSLEKALESIPEAKAYQGRSIALPPDDASADMWKEFDGKLVDKVPGLIRKPSVDDKEDKVRFMRDLGMPEDQDGYEKPEDVDLPDEIVADLTAMAFASGLTQEQYTAYLQTYGAAHAERVNAMETAKAQEVEDLKRLWGGAYEDNIRITDAIADKFAGKDMPLESLSNAERVALLNISKAVTSDPQIFNQVSTPATRKTPAEIEQRISDIRSMLLDMSVKGAKRKTLVREQGKLYEELDAYA